jgi:hypothetical protein
VILRSEPSSRAALMGEQPNPWDLSLPPLLVGQDYTFTMAISCHHERFRCEPCDRCHIDEPIYLTEAAKRRCRGSVVTGDESLDHCRRILTPSSRSDVQSGQCICPFSYLFEIIYGIDSALQNLHCDVDLLRFYTCKWTNRSQKPFSATSCRRSWVL